MAAKRFIGSHVMAGFLFMAGCLHAQVTSTNTNLSARESQIIAAARPDAAPQFNGACIIGIRPGTPLIHSLAVTGVRPIAFSAKNVPASLTLDPNNGIITGSLA